MESILSLPVLILGELVLVLLISLFFMWLYIRKQKAMLARMLEKSHQLKGLFEQREQEYTKFIKQHSGDDGTSLEDYLAQGIEDAQQRYEKFAQAKLPKIDPSQAFNAKVAALRYMYLTTEKEALEKRGNLATTWNLFEKKLAEIVRWFAKQTINRQSVRNNRNRLLQEKIDALKPFEEENKKLKRSLEQSKRRQEQLETYLRENKATIHNLQKMLNSLQHLNPDAAKNKTVSINDMSIDEYLTHSADQMDSIANVSDEKGHMIKNILYELANTHADMNPEMKKKMETSLRIMEIEMTKSDQYIANLKNELKDAKLQATNYALMLRDSKGEFNKGALVLTGADADAGMVPLKPLSHADYLDHEKVVMEIRQLRENNRTQRGMIVNLETEISLLKASIMDTPDAEVRKVKQQEVSRLERMVKECEHCIETLESEVDHLYSQLQERNAINPDSRNSTTNHQNNEIDAETFETMDAERLGMELEEMAKEMEKIMFQYRQTHAVNQLMYDLIKCTSMEEIAREIIQLLKGFNARAGFCIVSAVGKAEYFPERVFNESLKELVRSFSFSDPIFYLNDGAIFSTSKICLMLLPSGDDSTPLHESTLSGLVKVTAACIEHLESLSNSSRRSESMDSWISVTKNHLADLDIQYAYQVEENKKTFNNFIAEIRQAYHLLDLKGSGLILLDNAINEYEQRMYLLLSSGDIIDREISTLINHIDNLKVH